MIYIPMLMYILALLSFQCIYHSHVGIPFHSAVLTDFLFFWLLLRISWDL